MAPIVSMTLSRCHFFHSHFSLISHYDPANKHEAWRYASPLLYSDKYNGQNIDRIPRSSPYLHSIHNISPLYNSRYLLTHTKSPFFLQVTIHLENGKRDSTLGNSWFKLRFAISQIIEFCSQTMWQKHILYLNTIVLCYWTTLKSVTYNDIHFTTEKNCYCSHFVFNILKLYFLVMVVLKLNTVSVMFFPKIKPMSTFFVSQNTKDN